MTGYTKLFGTLIGSSLWQEADHVRLVWITMLAMKDHRQIVESSIPGLANFAKVPLEKCRDALKRLSEPDPDSRSKEFEGRRIREVEGGWLILNGEKYREKMNADERREANRIYQQRWRERNGLKKRKGPLPGEKEYVRGVEDGTIDPETGERKSNPDSVSSCQEEP